jgi:hypothetical protein
MKRGRISVLAAKAVMRPASDAASDADGEVEPHDERAVRKPDQGTSWSCLERSATGREL